MTFSLRLLIACLVLAFATQCFALSGEDIIRRVDANMNYDTAKFESRMVIHIDNEVRSKEMVSSAKGREKTFAEFLSPPRDKGTKYLKIGDNMWMYLPSIEKPIKIEGHMLRQSMMGSDFSYEDALESSKLLEKYDVKLLNTEMITETYKKGDQEVKMDRNAYVLDLTAKVSEVTYYQRKIWVDTIALVPLREELFAKSGKKLKVMEMGDIQRFGGRAYPMYMSMRNLLRENSLTEMFVTRVSFGVYLPESTFSESNLTK